jgi:hypothetical protein
MEVCVVPTEQAAVCRVNILNGGNGEVYHRGFLTREPLNYEGKK